MTPYHETFLPILLLGCLVAGVLSLVAGSRNGCILPGFLLLLGVLALWAALFFGSDMGYRAWQSMPDPPAEAFSDASVLGALVFGWVPAIAFCSTLYGAAVGFRQLLHWANPDAFRSVSLSQRRSVETGNPYQSPSNIKI